MSTPSSTDPSPRQTGEAAKRLILSAATASDPARLSRSLRHMVERSRGEEGVLAHPESSPSTPAPASDTPAPDLQQWLPEVLSNPPAAAADIDNLSATIEKVGRRLGCPHCCSGFDTDFQREMDTSVRNPPPTIPRSTP